MKAKITNPVLSSLVLLPALVLLISGCSGGNAGSSSGSGGTTDTDTTDNTDGTSMISMGEYVGNIDFSSINDSAPITIDVQDNDNVIVTTNGSGTATGSATGSSFTASGTLSFNLSTQTCSGFTSITGSSSDNTLSGTVTVSSANCVEAGVTTTITLDGTFSATL